MAISSHTATSGVTWGRPSDRTVEIQKSSASSSARRVSSHPVATVSGSLKRGSMFVTGSFMKSTPFNRGIDPFFRDKESHGGEGREASSSTLRQTSRRYSVWHSAIMWQAARWILYKEVG